MLSAFLGYLEKRGIQDVATVVEGEVVAFARHVATLTNRFGQPASPHQRRVWLSAVRAFFAFLERHGVVLLGPALDVSLPKVERLPCAVLNESEARRLMAAPFAGTRTGQRDRAILEVLYGTGLRAGECRRLDLLDVDLVQGQLLVRNGKGRRDRVVPVSGRAALALDVYLCQARPSLSRNSPALFLSKYGRRLSTTQLNRLTAAHARAAGIKRHVHPHVLRHTCATHLIKGGADIRHVQRLLGHACLETTAVYTRVEMSDLREMLLRHHPRETTRCKQR